MPALVAGINAFQTIRKHDVDDRDEPGHDEQWALRSRDLTSLHSATLPV